MDSKINYPYFIITKPREPFERITLSMAFLSNISNITFMVSGERKKNALLLLSKYKNDDAQIPSTELLRRSNAEIRVYCDQESFSTNLC